MPRCPAPSPLVLVVDDEPLLVELLRSLFAEEGYRVLAATGGAEALALVDGTPPDLVVSDVQMPGLDGIALVDRLRRRFGPIPVILTSAGRTTVDLADVAYLPKPFDLDRLLTLAEKALALRSSARQGARR